MANLLLTEAGREQLRRAACFLAVERLSRNLKRKFYRAWKGWESSGYFSLSTLLGSLNPLTQDDLVSLGNLLDDLNCCAAASTQDVTIYVDPVAGSDVSGDGSSTQPFASMAFMAQLPNYIDHLVKIVLVNDITVESLNIPYMFGPHGAISFIGAGAPRVVNTSLGTGPFAVNTAGGWRTPPILRYVDLASAHWGVDELYGKFIRFLTGSIQGTAGHIWGNNASGANDRITFRSFNSTNPTGTFDIVTPGRTLTVGEMSITASGPSFEGNNHQGSRVSFFNLDITLSFAPIPKRGFHLNAGVDTMMSFCRLLYDSTLQEQHIEISSNLNVEQDYDEAASALSGTGILNLDTYCWPAVQETSCGLSVVDLNALPLDLTARDLLVNGHGQKCCLCVRQKTEVEGDFGDLYRSTFGVVHFNKGASGDVNRSTVGMNAAGASVDVNSAGQLTISGGYFGDPTRAGVDIIATYQGNIKISDCSCTALYAGHGHMMNGIATVLHDEDPAVRSFIDVYFPHLALAAALPAANASTTELDTVPPHAEELGNRVTYIP